MAERIKEMHSSFVEFYIFKFRLHKYFILLLLLDFFLNCEVFSMIAVHLSLSGIKMYPLVSIIHCYLFLCK